MKKSLTFLVILSFAVLFVNSCSKKSAEPTSKLDDNGLTSEINSFVPPSLLEIIDSLGMPIHKGANPPSIGGSYLASPFKLINSNRATDFIGSIYADYYVKFSNQNNEELTVSVDYVNGPENGTGIGGFIVGENGKFSVFSELTVVVASDSAFVLNLVSGELSDDGIVDFYLAIFMIDNLGNPSGYFIANEEGRVFTDDSGLADEVADFTKLATGSKRKQGSISTIFKP
jgi:hypothetical protein